MEAESMGNTSKNENELPRTQKKSLFKKEVFKKYFKELQKCNNNSNIEFELMQADQKNSIANIFSLAYFYDQNFTGNKDFMHIPSVFQIAQNLIKYPIILAKQRNIFGEKEIIGATTIKFEENNHFSDNPFFPTQNEKVLSITGILAKQNSYDIFGNRVKGIGTKLFKTALRGAYEINKKEKIRLICEIDCRNVNSMNSLRKATEELQKDGINISMNLVGYYKIIKNNGELTEAPTFLFEMDIKNNNKQKATIFSYENLVSTKLFSNLANVIKNNTKLKQEFINVFNENIVKYIEIEPINISNLLVKPGTTAIGNDRIPITPKLEYIKIPSNNL